MIPIAPYPVGEINEQKSGWAFGLGLKASALPDRIRQLMLDGSHPTDRKSRDPSRNLFACVGEMIVARVDAVSIMAALREESYRATSVSRHQTDTWLRQLIADAERRVFYRRRPLDRVAPGGKILPTRANFWSLMFADLGLENMRWDECLGERIIDGGPDWFRGTLDLATAVWDCFQDNGDRSVQFSQSYVKGWLAAAGEKTRFDSQYEDIIRAVGRGRRRYADLFPQGITPAAAIALAESMVAKFFGIENTAVTRLASRVLLRDMIAVSIVPAVRKQPVSLQQLVILKGAENAGKSTLTRILANGCLPSEMEPGQTDFFFENLTINSKETDQKLFFKLRGRIVVEVREAKGVSAAAAEHLKAETERTVFIYDPKFLNTTVCQPRRYVMVITTNDMAPLSGMMDIRRWIVILVESDDLKKKREELRAWEERQREIAEWKGNGQAPETLTKPELPRPDVEWLKDHRDVLLAIAHDYLPWQGEMRLSDDDYSTVMADHPEHEARESWMDLLANDLQPVMAAKGTVSTYDIARWVEFRYRTRIDFRVLNKFMRSNLNFTQSSKKKRLPVAGGDTKVMTVWLSPGAELMSPRYEWVGDDKMNLGRFIEGFTKEKAVFTKENSPDEAQRREFSRAESRPRPH